MRAVDIVLAHSKEERRAIVVPEWDNLELWFGKITVSDLQTVAGLDPRDVHERNLMLLCLKAQDKEGNKLFALGDSPLLKREADWSILQNVVEFMYRKILSSKEEAAKKLEEDPTSGSA